MNPKADPAAAATGVEAGSIVVSPFNDKLLNILDVSFISAAGGAAVSEFMNPNDDFCSVGVDAVVATEVSAMKSSKLSPLDGAGGAAAGDAATIFKPPNKDPFAVGGFGGDCCGGAGADAAGGGGATSSPKSKSNKLTTGCGGGGGAAGAAAGAATAALNGGAAAPPTGVATPNEFNTRLAGSRMAARL